MVRFSCNFSFSAQILALFVLCGSIKIKNKKVAQSLFLTGFIKSKRHLNRTASVQIWDVIHMEVPPGFEPGHNGFADRGLTAWLWYQKMERMTRLELATSTLARWRSTR